MQKLKFNEESNIFVLERNQGLKSILGAIYQSFDGKDVYPTIEEKAAIFLHLLTKNHVFIDGNKRKTLCWNTKLEMKNLVPPILQQNTQGIM